jgi:methanogenic corrinoid protein MtbC1
LINEGYKISGLAQLIQNHKPLPNTNLAGLSPEHLARIEYLYNCLINFDKEKVEHTLANFHMGLTYKQLIKLVFTPILIRIGCDWQARRDHIAQEHFASHFLRLRLAPLLASFNPTSSNKKKAICTTLQNDQHEGGLILLSMHLKLRDWSIFYFGSQMPISDLKLTVERVQPNLVCISSYDHSSFTKNINEIGKLDANVCI